MMSRPIEGEKIVEKNVEENIKKNER